MTGSGRRAAFAFAAATALAGGLSARAKVEVDFATSGRDGQAAWCASSIVSGLDPEGDGFLAVRTGPGTGFPDGREAEERRGRPHLRTVRPVDRRPLRSIPDQGLVHGRWLVPYAG